MKSVLFYFSGTGNTMWVTEKICSYLNEGGVECEMQSIEQVDLLKVDSIINDVDIVGFGYPIYGSDLPEPMKEFIHSLGEINKRCFVFCSQLFFSGDGAWVFAEELKAKGCEISQSAHFIMPNNISLTPFIFRIVGPKRQARILRRAKLKAKKFVDAILSNSNFLDGKNGYYLGIIQRGPYRKYLPVLKSLIGVDESRCSKCGRCAKICPATNIKMTDFPEFLNNCTECMRCYNFCPESAITYWKWSHHLGRPKYQGPTKEFKPELLIQKKKD